MLKICYIADIQAETWDVLPSWIYSTVPSCDLYILGGDIAEINSTTGTSLDKVLQLIRQQTNVPILYVLGNHEYYNTQGRHHHNLITIKNICQCNNIVLLDRNIFKYRDYIIVGCSLWSNPNLDEDITYNLNTLGITYEQYKFYHQRDLFWLTTELQQQDPQKCIVVTHYPPDCSLLTDEHSQFNNGSMYCTNIWNSLPPVRLWLTGHVHNNQEIKESGKILISHSGGRHKEFIHPFKPILIDV